MKRKLSEAERLAIIDKLKEGMHRQAKPADAEAQSLKSITMNNRQKAEEYAEQILVDKLQHKLYCNAAECVLLHDELTDAVMYGIALGKEKWNYDGFPDNARKVWISYTCEGWSKPIVGKGIYSTSVGWLFSDNGWAVNSDWKVFAWKEVEQPTAPTNPSNPSEL